MTSVGYVAQPSNATMLDAIEAILRREPCESLDVAAAYITEGGVFDLLKRIDTAVGAQWQNVQKRWLTSFDYCRSQPLALQALMALPGSSVRVYDAHFCLSHQGTPKLPFHPKAFLLRNKNTDFALVGSGNLSRSGLSKGIEVGLTLETQRRYPIEPVGARTSQGLRQWFETTWNDAATLDLGLLDSYDKLFNSVGNTKSPTVTEDDIASVEMISAALSSADLRKLRICSNFWIQAGNITKNRGPHLPGNQLMMKRLSRVFFGITPHPVPENTTLGSVQISFDGGAIASYSLTYSDNKMDKIILPIPGTLGPLNYDNKCLLFRRRTPNLFELRIGSTSEKSRWIRKSREIDAYFRMSSGREWGVF